MSAPIATPWLSSQPDQDPRSATGKPLRWGVIATGGIARSVSQDLALLADAELRAVSSRGRDTAESFAGAYGFERAYWDDDGVSGYQRLLADDAVDVVYVATPHAQHHQMVLAALNAGKHVLCEKAFTINAREASELAALARERKLFLMEAVWSRFLPGMQRAFEIAASGELGDVHWVTADLGFPAPYSPTSRLWARQDGGGALLDISVYPLLWAAGDIGVPPDGQCHGLHQRRRRGRPECVDARLQPWRPGPADVVAPGIWPPDRHRGGKPGLPAERRFHQQSARTGHRRRAGTRCARRRSTSLASATPTSSAR